MSRVDRWPVLTGNEPNPYVSYKCMYRQAAGTAVTAFHNLGPNQVNQDQALAHLHVPPAVMIAKSVAQNLVAVPKVRYA